MNKADNQGFGALMGKPGRGCPSGLATTIPNRLSSAWALAVRRWFAMYVAFENEHAVFDTNERREVAPIPASQAPRAIVYLPGATDSEENPELHGNQSVGVIRLTAAKGDEKSRRIVVRSLGLMDLLEGQVSGLTPETRHRVTGRSLVIEKLVSGIESLVRDSILSHL